MPQTNALDFSTQAGADTALKQVSQLLGRAGQTVVSTEFSPKPRRSSDTTYREALLVLASGQTIALRVNSTGDIYQVLLNGSVKPLKEHTDTAKAVAEIAAMAEKNQAAFQKAQARKAVALPKGMSTPKPKQVDVLTQQIADLDAQIGTKQATIAELKAKLEGGAMTDSIPRELADPNCAAREVLMQLAKADGNALEDGQVASKAGRNVLIELGMVDRYTEQGENVLSDKGRACAAMLDAVVREEPPAAAEPNAHEAPGVLPFASAYVAATELAAATGTMLDSATASTEGAKAYLQIGLQIVEHNAPISLESGDIAQMRHQVRMAESFRAALAMLDKAGTRQMDDQALEQLVAIAKADAATEDEIQDQDALATLLALSMVDVAEGIYFLTEEGRQHLNANGMDAYGEPFNE
ncbi:MULTISPECIES: hypothetical protein [unclassified Pseudomonas]|uniref:defense against restriction DarA-related protein n=1 Tax=unclassified Pseudomonas TaxID=196821 RepID=UPI000A1F8FD7|nr:MULTISPECIES: hypothetical protein [unclassified Pseudomonas]